jgi:L-lactate dehydrogenase (cytochrome)
MNMRLLGAQTIKDITPDMVDISNISSHIASIPGDKLYDINCEFKILGNAQYFLTPNRSR